MHPGSSAKFKYRAGVREGNKQNREIREKVKTFFGLGKRMAKKDRDDILTLRKAIKTQLASDPKLSVEAACEVIFTVKKGPLK